MEQTGSNLILRHANKSCQQWTRHSEVEAMYQGDTCIAAQQEVRSFLSVPFGEIFKDAFQNLFKDWPRLAVSKAGAAVRQPPGDLRSDSLVGRVIG